MAITNHEVINKALREMGWLAAGNDAQADDALELLDILNQMMAQWRIENVDFHWPPQDTLGDTCPIPDWAERAIITNLAKRAAGQYRVTLSPHTLDEARESLNAVAVALMNLNLEGADMRHLPLGTGGRWDIVTDSF